MKQLTPITTANDISPKYRDTPIGLLLAYHNLNLTPNKYKQARLLIGTCMDHRIRFQIPENFAYIIRSGGGNLRHSEFKVSYAIAVGGVSSIALIGHNNCGMVGLADKKEKFISGLVEKTEWEKDKAEEHFMHFAPIFEIEDEIDFVLSEAKRLRLRYPNIQVALLLYRVEDNLLYMVREKENK